MNPYQNHTDSELLAGLVKGEHNAFEIIYYRYVKVLTSYVQKRISNREDCFEIVQDVFESLWRRRAALGHITVLEAYLFRMVKYKIIRYFQHNQVVKKYEDHFRAFEMIAKEASEEGSEIESLRAVIEESMHALPERCQMVVRLRVEENLTNGDIAKRMHINKATVKRYMTSALNYFRKIHPPLYKSR